MSLTADTEKAVSHSTHGIADAQGVSKPAHKTHPSPDIKTVKKNDATKDGDAVIKKKTDDANESRAPIKFFGIRAPKPIEELVYNVQDSWQSIRSKLVPTLPKVVVNSSSNIIGTLQVTGEILMLKSTGATLVPDKSNWLNYIVQPPRVIYETIFKKAQSASGFRDLLEPSKLLQNLKAFTNRTRAAELDSLGRTVPLLNRWQARSAFAGIISGFSSMMPETKELQETVEEKAIMLRNNPIKYFATCLGEALWFPAETAIRLVKKVLDPNSDQQIGEHKRQFAGLALLGAGVSSVISGFRQVGGDFFKGDKQEYRKNKWHIAGGLITSIAGNFLMTGINNQQGWSNFGSTQMGRMTILYPSISSRFKPGANGKPENNRWWYAAGQGVFQGKNMFASLVGGAEVKPDGTIDYHVGEKKEAIKAANAEKVRRKEHKESLRNSAVSPEDKNSLAESAGKLPSLTIQGSKYAELAMPERREAVLEAASAANV
jgi:hypothetical protein